MSALASTASNKAFSADKIFYFLAMYQEDMISLGRTHYVREMLKR